jgi:hypothetical protein
MILLLMAISRKSDPCSGLAYLPQLARGLRDSHHVLKLFGPLSERKRRTNSFIFEIIKLGGERAVSSSYKPAHIAQ